MLIIVVLGGYSAADYYRVSRCARNAQRTVSVEILPDLVSELDSSFACKRSIAAFQLQKLGPSAEPALPNLISLVSDTDASVRWRAIAAVGHIRKSSPEVLEGIAHALKDNHPTVLHNALFAAREVNAESLASDILKHATNPDPSIGAYAISVVRTFNSLNEAGKNELLQVIGKVPVKSEIKLVSLWPDTHISLNGKTQLFRPAGYTFFDIAVAPSAIMTSREISALAIGSRSPLIGLARGKNQIEVDFQPARAFPKGRPLEFQILVSDKVVYTFSKAISGPAVFKEEFDIP